ncbi:hypothetical protein [Porphyromonas somerae]|uniref:hypothetical protein n=1 Tax=Porphyromonas somerae TaxID=322095 RepID=UPI002A800A85|nr:hypothetical protein [Porphyromonas somerae]MDY3884360.1 hypothetical protein [Porphyromonas somerae]
MNTTTILNILLIMSIVWMSVAILYLIVKLVTQLMTRYPSKVHDIHRLKELDNLSKYRANEEIEAANAIKNEEVPFSLVGKSRPYISPSPSNDFPIVPATSPSEKSVENVDTFVPESPEQSGNSDEVIEEDYELQIDYTDDMEEVDEEQNEREALLIFVEPIVKEPLHSGGVLVKELALLQKTTQKEALDEEEVESVRETIIKLQGTDFLEQYKKNWIHIDKESKGILKVIREVEEQGQETASKNSSIINQIPDSSTSKTSKDEEKKPLSYYL